MWAGGLPTTRSKIHLTTQVGQSLSSVTHHNRRHDFTCIAAAMEEAWFSLNHVLSTPQRNQDAQHEGKHLLVQSLRHCWDQCARTAAFWVARLSKVLLRSNCPAVSSQRLARAGRCLAVMGPSGAGKSLLLHSRWHGTVVESSSATTNLEESSQGLAGLAPANARVWWAYYHVPKRTLSVRSTTKLHSRSGTVCDGSGNCRRNPETGQLDAFHRWTDV